MNQQHKVTILLATFNREHLIGETLDSILAQTYTNWECLIIDDNSTDNTEVFLKENYISKDSRFTFYKKPLDKYRKGLSDSRNFALDLARNANVNYIQLFDDDDIMHPQKLALQMQPFFDDVTIDMTLCKYRTFGVTKTIDFDLIQAEDNSSTIISNNLFWDFYKSEISLNSLGPIWKLSAIKEFRFNSDLVIGEEKHFYLKVFFHENIKYVPVNYILFWYRKHPKSVTKGVFYSDEAYDASLYFIKKDIYKMIIFSNKVALSKRIKTLVKYIILVLK